jgi:hypothetical protein
MRTQSRHCGIIGEANSFCVFFCSFLVKFVGWFCQGHPLLADLAARTAVSAVASPQHLGRSGCRCRCLLRCCDALVVQRPLVLPALPCLPKWRMHNEQMRLSSPHREAKGRPKKKNQKNKGESVGCFCVGLRFFGLFCKNLLHVILTPPARYQHPHNANNPQVGHWGNCEPKWWPQGSTSSSSSSSKTKQRTHRR